jgi:DNA (cytosine-5)-methyltransferase 1
MMYYNEFDPFAAAWLRNLMAEGVIPSGDVDERSIVEVGPDDLKGYDQCHFFAGIGGWSYALRLAGWDDARPVWTGSCPCQPFSAAGKQEGHADARHLWPEWFRLIRECRPSVVFGEQVAAAIGWGWLDLVSADLEGCGYAVGPAVLPAASVGAPHKRERLWFVADREQPGLEGHPGHERDGDKPGRERADAPRSTAAGGATVGVGDAESGGRGKRGDAAQSGDGGHADGAGGMADAENAQWGTGERRTQAGVGTDGERGRRPASGGAECVAESERGRLEGPDLPVRQPRQDETAPVEQGPSPWADLVWLPCRDGKARPTQPGILPLAHGIPNRVDTLRGAGNAIVPQAAAAFIEAYLGVKDA